MKNKNLPTALANNRGVSILAAAIAVALLGFAGSALVTTQVGSQQGSLNNMQTKKSLYVGHAGIEKAIYDTYWGLSSSVTDMPFADGTFTTIPDAEGGVVTVTSLVGEAKKIQAVAVQFAKNCVSLDTSNAAIGDDVNKNDGITDNDMLNITAIKSCNGNSIITEALVDWNWDSCVLNGDYSTEDLSDCPVDHSDAKVTSISLNGTTLYDPDTTGTPTGLGADPNQTIDVADYVMSSNATYTFDHIGFSETIPNGALTTITLKFLDGSQISSTFQIKTDVGFTISNGTLTVDAGKTLTLEVICTEITYGENGPAVPVKTKLKIGSTWNRLWSYQAVVKGWTYTTSVGSSSQSYVLQAYAKYGSWSRTYDTTNLIQSRFLKNDDILPSQLDVAGFGGQQPVADCLAPYTDSITGQTVLEGNRAIVLMELGVDNAYYTSNNSAADWQDLVMLFTIE